MYSDAEPIRLWKEPEFHSLQLFDGYEYQEMLCEDDGSEGLQKFIQEVPKGTQVRLAQNDKNWKLIHGESEFEITLNEYRSLKSPGILEVLMEAYGDGHVDLEKIVWTKDEYNHWRCWQNEDYMYPMECPKCDHMMVCSWDHSRAYDGDGESGTFQRVFCSNSSCKHVEMSDEFLAHIKEINEKKLKKQIKKLVMNFQKLNIEPWEVDVKYGKEAEKICEPLYAKYHFININSKTNSFYCEECGHRTPVTAAFISSEKTSGVYIVAHCERCVGQQTWSSVHPDFRLAERSDSEDLVPRHDL